MLTIIWSTSVTGGRFAVEPATWLKLAVGFLTCGSEFDALLCYLAL